MESFEILDVITMQKSLGEKYLEFFKGDNVSLGIYSLLIGEEDQQQPHTEDEVYYLGKFSCTPSIFRWERPQHMPILRPV